MANLPKYIRNYESDEGNVRKALISWATLTNKNLQLEYITFEEIHAEDGAVSASKGNDLNGMSTT